MRKDIYIKKNLESLLSQQEELQEVGVIAIDMMTDMEEEDVMTGKIKHYSLKTLNIAN